MRNIEKSELRKDIKDLVKKGYAEKEAIKTLIEYGYCSSTARAYWKCFYDKYKAELEQDEKKGTWRLTYPDGTESLMNYNPEDYKKGRIEAMKESYEKVIKFFDDFHKLVEKHTGEFGDPVIMAGLQNDFCAITEYWKLENELKAQLKSKEKL